MWMIYRILHRAKKLKYFCLSGHLSDMYTTDMATWKEARTHVFRAFLPEEIALLLMERHGKTWRHELNTNWTRTDLHVSLSTCDHILWGLQRSSSTRFSSSYLDGLVVQEGAMWNWQVESIIMCLYICTSIHMVSCLFNAAGWCLNPQLEV